MIEIRRFPGIQVVASRAIVVEISRLVVGLICISKGRTMATETVAGSICVRTGVAVLALNLGVGAFQRKARHIVIECRGSPSRHFVAGTAVLREVGGFVIGVRGVEII